MKFGSVEFFKKLIVIAFVIMVTVPLVLAVLFGVLYGRQKKRADVLEQVNWALLNTGELPEELKSVDDLSKYLQNPPPNFTIGPSFEYQKVFPELYTAKVAVQPTEGKIAYLTFDDGPSPVTLQVLKTLDEYGIKATFFVTGSNSEKNPEVLKAVADAGHTIGVHTYSHDYKEIYQSVDAYLADFNKMYSKVAEITGKNPEIFRFAGGSINVYNQSCYMEITAEMLRRGFTFFDWNTSAEDAVAAKLTSRQVLENVTGSMNGKDRLVVLMHDRQDNTSTAAALPEVIKTLQDMGYTFAPLGPEVEPVTFFYQE